MALTSGNWRVNINGIEAELVIGLSGPDGIVPINLLGHSTRGFWDELAQRLVFSLRLGSEANLFEAFFEGHLIRTPTDPAPGRDVVATLTGSFTIPRVVTGEPTFPALPSARRNTFGWFASITEVL